MRKINVAICNHQTDGPLFFCLVSGMIVCKYRRVWLYTRLNVFTEAICLYTTHKLLSLQTWFFFSFSYTPAKIVWYLWNSIEHHRRNSGIQPRIDPVSSKMRRLNKEIRYSMERGAFWCYGNIKLQENIRELAIQYLTVQYLLAMESLKLLIMNLNILVAVTSNFFNPCRYEAFEI